MYCSGVGKYQPIACTLVMPCGGSNAETQFWWSNLYLTLHLRDTLLEGCHVHNRMLVLSNSCFSSKQISDVSSLTQPSPQVTTVHVWFWACQYADVSLDSLPSVLKTTINWFEICFSSCSPGVTWSSSGTEASCCHNCSNTAQWWSSFVELQALRLRNGTVSLSL